jgi:hypothetical protein
MSDRPQWPVEPAEAMYQVSNRSLPAQVAQHVDIARAVAEAALAVGAVAVAVVLAAIGGVLVRMFVRRGDARRAREYVAALLARPMPRQRGRHRIDWRADDGAAGRRALNMVGLIALLSVSVIVCVGAVIINVAR